MAELKMPLLRDVIQNTVSEVYYCDHIMDNTFVRYELERTENDMLCRGYIPEGVCLNPEYSPQSGYGLKFLDEDGNTAWVHVPKNLMHHWLRQLKLTPPPDIVWDDDVWERYVWGMTADECEGSSNV